jgi:hypothetical protein
MKIKMLTLIVLGFCVQASFAASGGEAGNGGNATVCYADPKTSPFVGNYAIDYLLTFRNGNNDIVKVNSWEESTNRIARILKKGSMGTLSKWFANFVETMGNKTDYTRFRLWLEAPYGLVQLNDQNMKARLPKNCVVKSQGSRGEVLETVIQTVVRVSGPGNIIRYYYDPAQIENLKKVPLQYSFLMVHEWLWDVTTDVTVIRELNRYLHSTEAENATPEQYRATLEALGVHI